MPIDGTPIRRKARREYEKTLRELDTAKADVERFESQDKPQFDKWLHTHFGALLTEIRELQEKLFNAQDLVNEVQQEFYYGNYRSITNAYKKVVHRRNHPEELELEMKEEQAEEAEFRREFEEAMNGAGEFWKKMGIDPEELQGKQKRPKTKANNVLKELYRRLVRRLHPDKGSNLSPREVEWWHQTQEAYESGNIEQLEVILTLIELEDKGSKDASVSVLGQLTAEFKKTLKALKKKLATFKRELAWNFSQLTDFTALLRVTHGRLQAEHGQIVWLLQKYESQIQSWEKSAATAGARRSRTRRSSCQDEEWF